ncbi:MAG: hypothetical protein OET07_01795 [Desulfobacteraceae bacterium]|nr:hypothetical protein [Desulfobacteraceae bacterium]
MPKNLSGSPLLIADLIAEYEISVSNRFASLPSFNGECASEFDTSVRLSSADTRQFIAGSDERPVSIANIKGVRSSKHSSIESKPDFEPNSENHGVQMWAGIRNAWSDVSRSISKRSLASRPSMGLPSDFIFPILSNFELKFSA